MRLLRLKGLRGMRMSNAAVRFAAGAVGATLLAATAHVTITQTTGYADAHAALILAIAGGVGVGAWSLGHCWNEGRYFLATVTLLAMLSGELFGLVQTGDRIAAHREKQQAPLRTQLAAHTAALDRVAAAGAELEAFPNTTPRLNAAIDKKNAADAAVLAKSAERGCASNCRALLEQQVETAQTEVDAARAAMQRDRARLERELEAARHALADTPAPKASGTPLADRLGLPAATLDLITAGLGAVGANGLAACLIAFAAHRRRGGHAAPRIAAKEADDFAKAMFQPAPNGRVLLRDVRAAYHSWCAQEKREPLPDVEIAAALNALFSKCGLYREGNGSKAQIAGIGWRGVEGPPLKLIPFSAGSVPTSPQIRSSSCR